MTTVAIIGAGQTGASAALALAQRGVDVTLCSDRPQANLREDGPATGTVMIFGDALAAEERLGLRNYLDTVPAMTGTHRVLGQGGVELIGFDGAFDGFTAEAADRITAFRCLGSEFVVGAIDQDALDNLASAHDLTLVATGTRFVHVPVDEAEIAADGAAPFAYSAAFYQLVRLATLAGIGRAAASDAADILRARRRSYSNAAAPSPAEDPQLLQVIGRLRAHAYSAGAIVHFAARALKRAAEAAGSPDQLALIAEAEIEIWQAQTVVSQLIIDETASVFDALGASATLRSTGLDRYWRNARTIASHNPRVFKDRIVGDFAVNGRVPPGQWRIGER